jgi:hypothetical protein
MPRNFGKISILMHFTAELTENLDRPAHGDMLSELFVYCAILFASYFNWPDRKRSSARLFHGQRTRLFKPLMRFLDSLSVLLS